MRAGREEARHFFQPEADGEPLRESEQPGGRLREGLATHGEQPRLTI